MAPNSMVLSNLNVLLPSAVIEGEVSAPSLTVTQIGSVHGQVKVAQLKSQGEISGEIDADSVEHSGRG
jgi:cytoskeletal protein CcmA (bactofilin family)